MNASLVRLFCATVVLAFLTTTARALNGMVGVHDPSTVIECDGSYYVYATGRGVSVLTSSNGFDWQRGQKVFDRVPDSVKKFVPLNDGQGVWAPDIIKLNGQYYLYYAISSWGQFVSAVGLMTSPTLDPKNPSYKWTDHGMVVHSSEGENLNAIDPGVFHAPDGTLWICYGSYHGNIELVELNPQTGLRLATNSPVSIIASHSEASDMIYHEGFYYLLVNHGSCCKGSNSTYNIRVGRSKKVTGPYLDADGVDMVRSGGTLFLASVGNQIGPGHFGLLMDDGVEKFSCHYEADLERSGRSVLDIRPLLWSADGWPLPGQNITNGTYQIRSPHSGTALQSSTNAVTTAKYLAREDQKWNVTPAGGGYYKIAGAADTNVLEMAEEAGPISATAPPLVNVAPFTGADNQLWKIDQLSDGSYRIASKVNKFALTVPVKINPGKGVVLLPFTGDAAQRWVIAAP
jgi:arabinan endo-1,5-alpha-L-arabinosidase